MDRELSKAKAPAQTQSTQADSRLSTRGLRFADLIDKPSISFVVSEMWATFTSIVVYGFFLAGSWATNWVTSFIEVEPTVAGYFLSTVFTWAGAVGAAGNFVAITTFQLITLVLRLSKDLKETKVGEMENEND